MQRAQPCRAGAGGTAMHYAAAGGCEELLKWLLANTGPTVRHKANNNGNAPYPIDPCTCHPWFLVSVKSEHVATT